MNNKTQLAVGILFALAPVMATASNNMIEARGAAMGNTGVASADYLTAGLYNPALTASFKDNDDVGLLLPAFGMEYRDSDDTVSTLDDLQKAIDDYESAFSDPLGKLDDINRLLDDLEGNKPTTVSASLGFAVALPSELVSSNLYSRGYAEAIAAPIIAPYNATDNPINDIENRYQNSSVALQAFAYAEFGLALGKSFNIAKQDIAFGITPKFQQLRTYYLNASVADFDVENVDDSLTEKNAFNFDLGASWSLDAWRVGLTLRDLIAQEVDVNDHNGVKKDTYKLNPMVTVGAAYNGSLISAAVDLELTKNERFASIADETQFLRFGVEGNAWGWAQLRAGYEIDLQETADSAITAGIGISPFDVVSFDIAANYAGSNQVGAAANLAFTF
ncbi:conjugal transfer protein TraF [Vibrio sp. ZSDZ34]|jgi:hypothetical protein|uniref:Conjugal transfer protein TraF n=1 Tax=Vibrio gelatinilyticus TaxID=2893468 RepID=A0A9X2B0J3_9VIBR|nr:conjugal transfer protein TraF [Vibrio gelatinilyticus]MCJ2378643.1 conjugal transfer protein TraF [Vibrio gelatinilyticus]